MRLARRTIINSFCTALATSGMAHTYAAQSIDGSAGISEVIVTATRFARSADEVPASVTVLTRDTIAASSAQSVDELLQATPGLENPLSSSYLLHPTSNFPGMMGSKTGITSHVLVMLDGVPINDAYSGFVQWNRIPKENIERIEVVRGGGSTLWGSYAMSGVINVVTRAPAKDQLTIDAGTGSHGTYRADIYDTLIFTDVLKVSLNYGKFKTDGFNMVDTSPGPITGPKALYDKTSIDADNVQLVADYNLDRSMNGYARFNYHNNAQDDFMIRPMSTSQEIYGFDTGIDKTLDNDMLISANAFYNDGEFKTNNASYVYNGVDPSYISGSYLSNKHTADTHDYGGSLTTRTAVNDVLTQILAGVDLRRIHAREREDLYDLVDTTSLDLFPATTLTQTGNFAGRQQFLGAFAQLNIVPIDALEIVPSVRYQQWKNYDGYMFQAPPDTLGYAWSAGSQPQKTVDDVSWRLSARYSINKELSLRAATYKSFNAPTLDNLYRTYSAGGWYGYSNPDLKPERLYGSELGLDTYLGAIKTALTVFHHEIEDFLSYYVVADSSGTVNDNIGTVRANGAMLTADWAIAQRFGLHVDYTYTDSELVHSNGNASDWRGQQLALVPKNKIELSANYTWDRFHGSLSARHVSHTYGANGAGQSSYLQDAFTVVDASVGYDVTKSTDIYLDITNLLDRKYIANNDGWAPPLYGTPRTAFIGVRWNYE